MIWRDIAAMQLHVPVGLIHTQPEISQSYVTLILTISSPCSYDSQYDDPADAIHDEDDSIRKQRYTDSPKINLRAEQEMNLYSEPIKRTKKKRRPPSDDESEVSAVRFTCKVCMCALAMNKHIMNERQREIMQVNGGQGAGGSVRFVYNTTTGGGC